MTTFSRKGFYLALETSGPEGSVAVARGDVVLARGRLEERGRHAARLIPAVDEVLDAAGVDLDELTGVVVGAGPGSFTGVRVAAATAKGLVHGLGVPLWALSSLAAAAAVAGADGSAHGVCYVLFDARGDRVYAACYGVGHAGVSEIVAPHFAHLRDLLAGDIPAGAVFAGDAAMRHRRAIEGAGLPVAEPPLGYPSADGLIRLLGMSPETPSLESPSTWEPSYLRASNAERGTG